MANQCKKNSPGIEDALINCTGEIKMDNFDCLNSSFSLFYFHFVKNLRKRKNYGVGTLPVEPPPSPIRGGTLLAGISPHPHL